MTEGFPNAEQQQVIELPAAARTLVVADAGTGKTDTLIARISHLIDAEGISPGTEILVLSFSRAAVGEIKRRVSAQAGGVGYIRASTFDSLATSLLAQYAPDAPWIDVGYDGRIKAATALIEQGEAQQTIGELRHVLVDEIQDLVDVRLDLTKQLIEATSGGFTLLGDPAQAIYDWQEAEARIAGPDLFSWLRDRYGTDLSEHRLSLNYRARTDLARAAIATGKQLNNPEPDYSSVADELNTLTAGLMSLGPIDTAQVALKRMRGTAAVLCRTNGQALTLSSRLRELDVSHTLRRRATDRAIVPWIGRIFSELDAGPVGASVLEERIAELTQLHPPVAANPIQLLKRMSLGRSSAIEGHALSRRISTGQAPDELSIAATSSLTLSTVHRAKGLEFDQVVVLEPARLDGGEATTVADEVRVRYVALDGARDAIYTTNEPPYDHLHLHKSLQRWVRTGWERWHRTGLELVPRDIDHQRPAAFTDYDATDTQRYLWGEVTAGDDVTLELDTYSPVGLPRAYYRVIHHGRPIAKTSDSFSMALHEFLKVNASWEVRWPRQISGCYVDAVDTVAGTAAAGGNAGLGTSGIWLRGRVGGLGRFEASKGTLHQ